MSTTCEKCKRDFPSRNKLFKHLKNPLGCEAATSTPESGLGGHSAGRTTDEAGNSAAGIGLRLAQLVARLAAGQGGMLQAASAGELLSRYHGGLLRCYQRSLGSTARGVQDATGTWLAALVPEHPNLLSVERVAGELHLRCDDALATAQASARRREGSHSGGSPASFQHLQQGCELQGRFPRGLGTGPVARTSC